MKTTATPRGAKTEFETMLLANIKASIKRVRSDGTVAMGVANLLQITRTPNAMASLAGAPSGPETYRVMFERLCAEDAAIARFTQPCGGGR